MHRQTSLAFPSLHLFSYLLGCTIQSCAGTDRPAWLHGMKPFPLMSGNAAAAKIGSEDLSSRLSLLCTAWGLGLNQAQCQVPDLAPAPHPPSHSPTHLPLLQYNLLPPGPMKQWEDCATPCDGLPNTVCHWCAFWHVSNIPGPAQGTYAGPNDCLRLHP